MVVVPHRENDYHCSVERCFKGSLLSSQHFEMLLGRNPNKPKAWQLLVRFPPNSSISHLKVFNIFSCVKTINIPSSSPQDDICKAISIRHPPLSCCFSLTFPAHATVHMLNSIWDTKILTLFRCLVPSFFLTGWMENFGQIISLALGWPHQGTSCETAHCCCEQILIHRWASLQFCFHLQNSHPGINNFEQQS